MRAALLCLLLTGCATTVDVQRVEIPVPVACVDARMIPAEPVSKFDAVSFTAPLDHHVQALLLDRERGQGYSRKLRALLDACVTIDATSSTDLAPSPVKP